MRKYPTWALVLLLLGCKSTGLLESTHAPSTPAAPVTTTADTSPLVRECSLKETAAQSGKTFGGSYFGFPVWLSSNGRFVVLYQFRSGPSADGKTPPNFGHHGESLPAPQPVLFDLAKDTEEPFDDWLNGDPEAHYAVLRKGAAQWLIDSQRGTRLELGTVGASGQPDENRCLPPREVAFDPTGSWLSFLKAPDERVALLRHLDTGEQIEIQPGSGRLWRVEPEPLRGWATLREVAKDSNGDGKIELPKQGTSCACRYCRRFARSYSFYGWSGDEFHSFLVSAGGARLSTDERSLMPLSANSVLDIKGKRVLSDKDAVLPLPADCDDVDFAVGTAGLLLRCVNGSRLYFPETQRALPLSPHPMKLIGSSLITAPSGERWAPVIIKDKESKTLARLDMERGKLDPLLPVSTVAGADDHGWLSAITAEGFVVVNLATRAIASANKSGASDPDRLTVKLGEKQWAAIDPARCHYFTTAEEPAMQDSRGCLLRAAGTSLQHRALETGPWHLDCPQ